VVKIGINLWAWVSPFRTDRDLPLIHKAKSMGAEVVEFCIEEGGVVDTAALKNVLSDCQVGCSVIGLFGPGRDFSSPDAATRQTGLDHAKRCVDTTAEIGAPVFTGAVVGVAGEAVLSERERQDRLAFASETLRQIGEHAGASGVGFGVEILNRYESNFVTTAREARELADLAGHEAVGIHLDTFHMGIEENNLGEAIRTAGEKLMHLHASASHRGTPGRDHLNWKEISEALNDIDYRGYAVIESFNPQGRLAPLARCWRPFADTQDQLAREGLQFLKSILAT
jgi:D-psicose/D-tagatose/L-ribulose 3-epimerase